MYIHLDSVRIIVNCLHGSIKLYYHIVFFGVPPYFGSQPNAGSPFCFNLNHLTIVISSDFISINWTPQRNESPGFFSYKLFTEITHTFHDEQTLRSFSRTINFDCQLCNPILMNMFSFVIWLIFSLSLLCVFFCQSFFIAGPAFWGLINPQWNMCTKGRRQSPIDIEPDKLLFDPYLRPLHIDKHKVNAINYMKNGYLIWLKKESIEWKRAFIAPTDIWLT